MTASKAPVPQSEPPDLDSLGLYKRVCDIWAEANAIDTFIGRPDALMAKLTALRDDLGAGTATWIAAVPQSEPTATATWRHVAVLGDDANYQVFKVAKSLPPGTILYAAIPQSEPRPEPRATYYVTKVSDTTSRCHLQWNGPAPFEYGEYPLYASPVAAQDAPELPQPGSPEATAMIQSALAARGWPANPNNAARAGWEAARSWLRAAIARQTGGTP